MVREDKPKTENNREGRLTVRGVRLGEAWRENWAAAELLQPEAEADQRDYFREVFAKSRVMDLGRGGGEGGIWLVVIFMPFWSSSARD